MTIQEQLAAQARREQLQKEINANKVVPVDTAYYHKTEHDKAKLYKLKNEWKTKVAAGYIVNKFIMAGSDTIPLAFRQFKEKFSA